MAIAAIANIPGTEEELAQWAFAHQAHHVDINAAIYRIFSVALPQYVLDPFSPANPEGMGIWIYQHQQMHANQDYILGISGYNLVDVDFTDRGQLANWIALNFNEHLQAADILSVG